jgi:diketogulonate reductase-like aldo/keto reductase
MTQKLYESVSFLQKNFIDVVLLHAPYCWPNHCTREEEAIPWQKGWRNLQILQKLFGIKGIGVSNFHLELLQELVNLGNVFNIQGK